MSRSTIMEQIMATQQQIEQNSPSKVVEGGIASHIDRDMIQRLKERRLLQRSKSREQPGGGTGGQEDADGQRRMGQDTNKLIQDIQQRLTQSR